METNKQPLTAEGIYNSRITEEDTPDGYYYKPNFELTIKDEFIEGCNEFAKPLLEEIEIYKELVKTYDLKVEEVQDKFDKYSVIALKNADKIRELEQSLSLSQKENEELSKKIKPYEGYLTTINELESELTSVKDQLQNKEILFKMLAEHGGEIVSSASLDVKQIKQAQASGRMCVDDNWLGYVWMPNLTRLPETDKEVEFFEKWFPLDEPMPEGLKDPSFLFKKKAKGK